MPWHAMLCHLVVSIRVDPWRRLQKLLAYLLPQSVEEGKEEELRRTEGGRMRRRSRRAFHDVDKRANEIASMNDNMYRSYQRNVKRCHIGQFAIPNRRGASIIRPLLNESFHFDMARLQILTN